MSGREVQCTECNQIFTLKYQFLNKGTELCPNCGSTSSMAVDVKPKPSVASSVAVQKTETNQNHPEDSPPAQITDAIEVTLKQILSQLENQSYEKTLKKISVQLEEQSTFLHTIKNISVAFSFVLAISFFSTAFLWYSASN